MLFGSLYRPRRGVIPHITDDTAKRTLSRARIILQDGPVPVEGQIIGWKRTHAGPLGAVVANPVTGARSLWGVDFATGRPRPLARLG